ncbi:hypothetical protein AB1Y20_004333 [Prymnesium parvum]|uniref:SGNH hydrolase-type esterase domain-containing protein n=1 Tax=Prymnesium parvum TaxID=97485 RepID=A0AB34IW30_PRYPA
MRTLLLLGGAAAAAAAAAAAYHWHSKRKHIVVVACVGDSITAGFWQPPEDLWPSKLQASLGQQFIVHNLGKAGHTAQREGDQSYWATEEWRRAKELQADMNIVMLGTNDAKSFNWDEQRYERDMRSLLAELRARPSQPPQMLLMTPPPVYQDGQFDIRAEVVNHKLSELIPKLAVSEGCAHVDLNKAFRQGGSASFFSDGVHPTAQGHTLIAEVVHRHVLQAGRP